MKTSFLLLALAGGLATATAQTQTLDKAPLPPAEDKTAADAPLSSVELAKQTQNPVASLISVPIQNNWDFGIGPANAMKYTGNIQPVIPLMLNQDWKLIVRTIVPFIEAESPFKGGPDHAGLGDIEQGFYLARRKPVHGWIISCGPELVYPTATEDTLGAGKLSAGPSLFLLRQEHGFTYGIKTDQLWSYAGEGHRPDVSASYFQPFLAYTTKHATSFGLNTESTYNWEASAWTVPINVGVTQLIKIGKQPVSLQLGYRYYAQRPTHGPDWGLRFSMTFLFPK